MNKLITFIIGVVSLYLGLDGVITGETTGIGPGHVGAGRDITYTDNPIEFVIVVTVLIGLGGIFIKHAFKKDKEDD